MTPVNDLRHFLAALRRRLAVFLLVTVAVAGGGTAWSLSQNEVYEAQASVLAASDVSGVLPENRTSTNDARRQLENEVNFFKSDAVRDAAVEALGFSASARFSASNNADLIVVTASADDPVVAANIANTFAQAYLDERLASQLAATVGASSIIQQQLDEANEELGELRAPIDTLNEQIAAAEDDDERELLEGQAVAVSTRAAAAIETVESQITTLEALLSDLQLQQDLAVANQAVVTRQARPPSSPVSPVPIRDGVIAGIVGLILGALAVLLIEYLDDSIRTADDIESAVGLVPVLGTVPQFDPVKKAANPYLTVLNEPNMAPAEAFRSIRTSLQFASLEGGLRKILVTSANPSEGKTTTAANLALAHAGVGMSVALICFDWRRPRVHEIFGLDNDRGFTSVLLGRDDRSEGVSAIPSVGRLEVIPSGPVPPQPSEVLANDKTHELVDSLFPRQDVVFIDAPPILPVTDAALLSARVDGVVVVVQHGQTRRRDLADAVATLRRGDARIVGVIINGSPTPTKNYYQGLTDADRPRRRARASL